MGEVLSFVGLCRELVDISLGICLSLMRKLPIRIKGLPIKEARVCLPGTEPTVMR